MLSVGAAEHPSKEECEYPRVLAHPLDPHAEGTAYRHDRPTAKGEYREVLANSSSWFAVPPPCRTGMNHSTVVNECQDGIVAGPHSVDCEQSTKTPTTVDVRWAAPENQWQPSGRYVLPARRVQQDRRELVVSFDGEHQPKYHGVFGTPSERDRELPPPSTSTMDVSLLPLDLAQSNDSTRIDDPTSGARTPGENESSFSRVRSTAGTSSEVSASTCTTRRSSRAQTRSRSRELVGSFPMQLDELDAPSARRQEPSDTGEQQCSPTIGGTETEPVRVHEGATVLMRGGTLQKGEGSGASSGHRLRHTTTSTSREDVLVSNPAATWTPSRELDVQVIHGDSTRRSATRTLSQGLNVQYTSRVASTSHSGVMGSDAVTGCTSSVELDVRASRRTSRQEPPVPRVSSDRLDIQNTGDRRGHDLTREDGTSRREVPVLNQACTPDHPVTVDVSQWPTDEVLRELCFSLLADQLDHDFDEAESAASDGEWAIWAHCKRSALSCGQAIEEMSPRPGTYSRAARRAWDHFQRELEVVPLEFDPLLVAPLPMEMVRYWAYNKLGWLVVPPRSQPQDDSDWYNSSDEEPRTTTREDYSDHVESESLSESEHHSSWDSSNPGSEGANSVVVSDYYEQSEMEDTYSFSALSAEDEGNSEDADYYSESE
ncbi:uncharacterized protein B0H18DRAFT_999691 [Fomitopsis serialis]|uniref:uncharacterized protein n=1 Tax=Fomitopsis serialis TaxID=139415 RepID=UPI0020085BC5|nr:uncharacterized protein B0H18DRAFT_999691 [Neoantrodia serialis]KAH9928609.1 hypothetical protein B0H18DRAFT_999691 [Neoantrodia serialis]